VREEQTLALYRLEKVAQEAQIQIVSERLRSSILSALSHDIRTPLTSLCGLAESLRLASSLDDQTKETLDALKNQALNLNSMVNNLLDMARLQAGELKFRKEWYPLEEVIGSSINLLKVALQQHPVKVDIPLDLPLLEFDAILMERVFCNLLENSAKYSPAGTTLTITANLLPEKVEICVCNMAGDGFPAHKLQQVFELFERGITESTVTGVGLGLSICRAIIEAHNGSIYAKNLNNGGACTCFILPLGNPPELNTDLIPNGSLSL